MCSFREKKSYRNIHSLHWNVCPKFNPTPKGRGGGLGVLATAQLNCSTVADIIQRSLTMTPEPSSSQHCGAHPPPHLQPISISLQKIACFWPWVAPHPRMSFSTPSCSCWGWGVNKTMCGLMMEWFEGCILRTASLFTGRINQNYGL